MEEQFFIFFRRMGKKGCFHKMCAINCIDSQSLLIQVLLHTELAAFPGIRGRFALANADPAMRAFFQLCVSFVLARKQRGTYCDCFDSTCRAIIAQQTKRSEAEVLKREYVQAMGWPNDVQFNRIEKGRAYLYVDSVLRLCGGFSREADRRFWRNQVLAFFPATQFPLPEEETEYRALCLVLQDCMMPAVREAALRSLPAAEREKLEGILRPDDTPPREDLFGEPPHRLYAVIERLLKARHISVERLVEEELYTSLQSWYSWKPRWEKAESEGFRTLPKPRIPRRYLLAIAVVCRLKYFDMLRLLQLGGYRLGLNPEDAAVAEAFLRGQYDAEQLMRRILNMRE